MPMARAVRLCRRRSFLPVDMRAYVAVHEALLELFRRFTDLVEPVSIDESVPGRRRQPAALWNAGEIATSVQRLVHQEHDLSCSIGIGPTKLLAKMAANLRKPGGITHAW